MEEKNKKVLSKADFERVHVSHEEAEKITVESVSFWRDAFRRLRKNKGAILSFYIIAILVVLSVFAPMKPFNRVNYNGEVFNYKHAPEVLDEKGNRIPKKDIFYLPPRIPGIEKLGFFDGKQVIEISRFSLLIGNLPKTDKFLELQQPFNKKKLIEELKMPYHPHEIIINNIYMKDSQMFVDYEVIKTKEKKTSLFVDMASKYTEYKPDNFTFVSSKVDKLGINMVKINKDFYKAQNVTNQYFWFGTDSLALDNWTRLWVGIRVSLLIALSALILDFGIGIVYGTIAGFFTGTWVDNLMMRITEILGSIPFLVFLFIFISIKDKVNEFLQALVYGLATGEYTFMFLGFVFAVILAFNIYQYAKKQINNHDIIQRFKQILIVFGVIIALQFILTFVLKHLGLVSKNSLTNEDVSFIIVVFAMSLTGWIGVARIVRAQIIKLRDQEFVLAARTLGAGNSRIMRKHLFPNIIGQLMVLATFKIPGAIFTEAYLTFIGLGLPIPMSSLGVLVFNGYSSIKIQPTLLFIPAFMMSILMLAINLLANGLRDALDPRMR